MSDAFLLGAPPDDDFKNTYVFRLLEYTDGPRRCGVCVQKKYGNALQSFKTVTTKTGTNVKYSCDFSWLPPSKRLKVIVESGNWSNKEMKLIERSKVDNETLPEDCVFFPPMENGTKMAIKVKLVDENSKYILVTEPVVLNLPEPKLLTETRPGVENP